MADRESPAPRKRAPLLAGALALAFAVAGPAGAAAEVRLHEVRFPEKGAVDVPFTATDRAPAGATLEAEARVEGARTRVTLSFRRMTPALLFGGDVTAYAAWAVTREGVVENLGELFVKDPKGTASFSTGQKAFALLVTAEPYLGVSDPSDLVVFAGSAPASSRVESAPFVLARLASRAKPATASLASLEWKEAEPVELVQARAILAQAEKAKAGDPDQKTLREARAALADAEKPSLRGSSDASDAARRASALSSAAIREVVRRKAAEEAARLEADRHAKEEARKAAATDEAERRRQSEATLAEVEELRQKVALEVEQARQANAALAAATALAEEERLRLAGETAALEREREAVASRLGPALASIAGTEATRRGYVVTLPGNSFDAGRASLKAPATVALGKLAGILLMVPDRNVRIEAHTDATGSEAANRKLSEARARAVADLLREQGIAEERVTFEGYGPDLPIASNATADGRGRNRRVEIVVGEGTIEAAPMESEPPSP